MKERTVRPGKTRSIARQALVTIVLTELVCLLALAGVSIWHERRVRLHALDVLLEGRADSVFGAVQDAEDVNDTVEVDPREVPLPRGEVFAVFDAAGRPISVSAGAPAQLVTYPGEVGWRTERVGHHRFRVLRQRRLRIIDREETGGKGMERPVEILYAMPVDAIWRETLHGVAFLLGTSLVLILSTMAVLLLLLRRFLRPIEELAVATRAVSAANVSFVAPNEAMQLRELAPLATALTTMVERLRAAFDRQHRFLGDATHELKTAVAVVRSSMEVLLLRVRTPEEYARGLGEAVRDNERVEELISRMLLLARLEEQPAVKSRQARVLEVARRCHERLVGMAERNGVGLAPVQGEEEVLVAMAPADLEVLLVNLLVNAIEHGGRGAEVWLRVRCEGETVAVQVIDNGCGIPEEALPYLFERFFRVDGSRARSTGGAGLGLAIAKAIAEANGGSIAVASRVDAGTAMTVRLPLAPVRAGV